MIPHAFQIKFFFFFFSKQRHNNLWRSKSEPDINVSSSSNCLMNLIFEKCPMPNKYVL